MPAPLRDFAVLLGIGSKRTKWSPAIAVRPRLSFRPIVSRLQWLRIAGWLVGVGLVGQSPAHAQTASQITLPPARPLAAPKSTEIVIPVVAGTSAPKGAERLTVRLSSVAINDETTDTENDSLLKARRAFEAALVGKTVTVEAVFQAARDLEAAYALAGFALTRVVVPAQKLVDGGTLKVVVIDGFIERIDVEALPLAIRSRIGAVLEPVVDRKKLKLGEIERALMLAGDTPGTALKSTLAPGKRPGGSVLIVEARHKPINATVSTDNTVGRSLGGVSSAVSVQVNSPFGFGEQFYAQASGFPRFDRERGFFEAKPTNRQVSVGANIPLGVDGLSLILDALRADSAPKSNTIQSFYSEYQRLSVRMRYAAVRSRAFNMSTELSFDIQDEDVSAIKPVATPISRDRLRIVRSGNEISGFVPWGAFLGGRIVASLGLDALGARDAASATATLPLSRQGADASFSKIEFMGRYGQVLAPHLGIDLFVHGQHSFGQAMAHAEQIGLIEYNGVSGFDRGSFMGDSGLIGRAEISSSWSTDLGGVGLASAAPYLFGGFGTIWLMSPTAVEQEKTSAASWGVGIRFGGAPTPAAGPVAPVIGSTFDQAILSIEWNRQYRTDAAPTGDRFIISGSIQF